MRSSSITPRANRPWRRPGCGVEREVDHHRARAGLRARVDAHHARRHRRPRSRRPAGAPGCRRRPRRCPPALTAARSSRRDTSTISSRRGVDADPLARLHEALRHLARQRRADLGVGERLAREFGRRARGLERGARAGGAHHRGVERGRRDEALLDEGAVVGQRALGDVELRRAPTRPAARPGAARQSYSVVSSRPSNWPALTLSPSRTVICLTSAATRALTIALS